MRSRNYPGFIRYAGSVGTKCVIVSDAVHDALFLANFLAEDVAEHATVAVAIPFARRAKLVQNAARHECGSGELRVRVRPFFSGSGALILEYGYVLESGVALQILDPQRIGLQYSL